MDQRGYKELLLRLAEGRESSEELALIKNSIKKIARIKNLEQIFRIHWSDDYTEDVLYELREKLIRIKKTIQNKQMISWGYLSSILTTCIFEFLNKNVRTWEIALSHLEKDSGEDGESWVENAWFYSYSESKESLIEGEELYKQFMEVLKPEDYPVICYYLCKEMGKDCQKPEGLSEANLYKRWERLRKRILSSISQTPSEEAFRHFVERLWSEICLRDGYIKVGRG